MSSVDINESMLKRDTFSSDEEEELKFSESEDDHQRRRSYTRQSSRFSIIKRDFSRASLSLLQPRRKSSIVGGVGKRGTQGTLQPPTPPSSDAESSEKSDTEDIGDGKASSPDLPPEYWQVQKLMKFIKAGNSTATIISLSSLRDFDLTDEIIQRGIREAGGVEVLLNILETDESTSKRAALLALKDIASNTTLCRLIFNMKGLETLIPCLDEPVKEIKLLAAEIISKICHIRKARRAMRKSEGIQRLVDMLDVGTEDWDVARCGAMALWSLAKSTKNKEAIRKAGAIPLLAKLVTGIDVTLVVPVVGILQECASDPTFRTAIRTEGLLGHFVDRLSSDCAELVQFSAKAIYMCAKDEEAREMVYNLGATEPLICIIQSPELRENKPLLAAATGAIWKCSNVIFKNAIPLEINIDESGMESTKETPTQGLVGLLATLLEYQPEEILINASGSLYNALRMDLQCYAGIVKRADTTPKLIALLKRDNEELLVNATRMVGELARDGEARREMEKLDGFRLVWSLLKHSSPRVQASAAKAICPYVESSKNSSEMVRNYVGGLEALVHLLGSSDIEVRSAVAYAIGCIAKNTDNLAIMSDHAVVRYLARLAPTPTAKDDELRECLATAIARCCPWKDNCSEFGYLKAVAPVCGYLSSPSPKVHRAAAKALHALSADARNCVTIHQCGVVPALIGMSGSLDDELRVAVAGIMANIRKLALSAEKVRLL